MSDRIIWALVSIVILSAMAVNMIYSQEPAWPHWLIGFALGLGFGVTATNALRGL